MLEQQRGFASRRPGSYVANNVDSDASLRVTNVPKATDGGLGDLLYITEIYPGIH